MVYFQTQVHGLDTVLGRQRGLETGVSPGKTRQIGGSLSIEPWCWYCLNPRVLSVESVDFPLFKIPSRSLKSNSYILPPIICNPGFPS